MPGGDIVAAAVATIAFTVLLVVLRAAPPEALAMLRRPSPKAGG
ncbi:MAG: hypothetical protein AAGC46_08510 [Solirubrobacteraceae bacterium]